LQDQLGSTKFILHYDVIREISRIAFLDCSSYSGAFLNRKNNMTERLENSVG